MHTTRIGASQSETYSGIGGPQSGGPVEGLFRRASPASGSYADRLRRGLGLRTVACSLSLLIALAAIAVASIASAQTSTSGGEQEVENDSDPTRPVFVSVRPEFYTVDDNVAQRAMIFRIDAAAFPRLRLFHGARGAIFRFEMPFMGVDVGRENRAGLGDTYAQAVVLPYVKRHFVWAVGTGVAIPTATDPLLGSGKWIVAPVMAPVWRMPRTLVFVRVHDFLSFAGDRERADVHYLLVTPTFVHLLGQRHWVLVDTETRTTWTDGGRTGVKSGLQLGARIAPSVGLWIKPEVWWGPNRSGQWNLKFGLVWYQRRPVSPAPPESPDAP